MPESVVLYLGFFLVVGGIVMLFTRWRRRWLVPLTGVALAVIALLLPAGDKRIARRQSRLDELVPVWQFDELHQIRTDASCATTWAAVKSVAAGEIRLFRTLTWIRRMGKPGSESILNPPENAPILEVALRTGFRLLTEEPQREVVIGMPVIPPDRANAFMNFRLTSVDSGSCEVTTETRVHATDRSARRRFAMYWRVIYPGSALIRRMWLRAIRDRTEATRDRS